MAAEFGGIKFIRQFLCLCRITDAGKGIVITFVGNAIRVKHTPHQFPAIYVDLDIEREPCLYFYKHEPAFLIQIAEAMAQAFRGGWL